MPLFEYRCLACGESFELLIRGGTEPACPKCASSRLEKTLSLFSVSSDATRGANLKAARAKSQIAARDKAVADAEEIRNHHH